MKAIRLLALSPALLTLLLVSCGGGSDQPTTDIVARIPWPNSESLTYVLKDSRGRQTATGTLSIDVQGAGTRLAQRYASGANSDEITVSVDSQTLKPESSRRVIVGSSDDEELEVTYTAEGAIIKHGEKQSGVSVPEHAYDNDSSLFLWRTIDFREGYMASYVSIITNRRSKQTVALKVTGREQVSVPAGQFNAWRLEIKAEKVKQVAWYADTPARTLVKYDNDNGTIFELQQAP